MNVILFDDSQRSHFLPLTFTRPVGALRMGIYTMKKRWEKVLNAQVSHFTEGYLSGSFPMESASENFLVNARYFPLPELVREIQKMNASGKLVHGGDVVAMRMTDAELIQFAGYTNDHSKYDRFEALEKWEAPIRRSQFDLWSIERVWDLFQQNARAVTFDMELVKNSCVQKWSSTNTVIGKDLYLDEGARVEASTINTETGPVYIGKNAEVMEGCIIRGPFALGEGAQLKMGAKVYGPTTIGPYCKAGGEISNSVMTGYSNKGHDGFMGNSVLGEWCNLGADTNTSNLKNNYGEVKIWNYPEAQLSGTGLAFCGLVMGDHSKCSINTMFNTGTVVGVSANIFGSGFPAKFIPSYAWGGHGDSAEYDFDKAMEVAKTVYERRNKTLSAGEREVLKHVFEVTAKYRANMT